MKNVLAVSMRETAVHMATWATDAMVSLLNLTAAICVDKVTDKINKSICPCPLKPQNKALAIAKEVLAHQGIIKN